MTDPLDTEFSEFIAYCRSRLELGREAYGARSFSKDPAALLTDIDEELADAVNYLFILHSRMRRLETALATLNTVQPEAEPQTAGQPSDFDAQVRAGVQIDTETFAELVAAAEALRLTPSAVLRMALRALAAELGKGQGRRVTRLVGAERGRLGSESGSE